MVCFKKIQKISCTCARVAYINNKLWIPDGSKIKIYSTDFFPMGTISLDSVEKIHSVIDVPQGVVVAAGNGLHLLNSRGNKMFMTSLI